MAARGFPALAELQHLVLSSTPGDWRFEGLVEEVGVDYQELVRVKDEEVGSLTKIERDR